MGCDAIFWFYSTHILISPGCSLSVRLHPCRLPLAENPRRSNSMTWNEPASLRGRRSRRYRWIASGGICAAVRPASNTAAAVSPVLNLSRASPSPAPAICTHPGRWRGGAGAQNIRGGICAAVRPASNTAAAVSPVLNLSHASPSPALAICAHPGRWRGGAGVPNIRGHLRSSAPGQQHSGSGQPGAEPELRQPVTRSRICTHPGRWRGGAGVQNIREHLRSSAPCQQHSGSGQPGAEPEPRQPVTRFRDLHPSRTLARWRGSAEPLGHLRGSAPGQHHGVSGQPAAEPEPRQPVTRSRDLHPPRTLARWRGSSEHQEESAQQCGRNSARQLT